MKGSVGFALLMALADCQLDPVLRAHEWARECGLPDLQLRALPGKLTSVTISEPHEEGLRFGDPDPAEYSSMLRQSHVQATFDCMKQKADAAGIEINYPVTVYMN